MLVDMLSETEALSLVAMAGALKGLPIPLRAHARHVTPVDTPAGVCVCVCVCVCGVCV